MKSFLALIFVCCLSACSATSPTLGWDREFLENVGVRERAPMYAPPTARMDPSGRPYSRRDANITPPEDHIFLVWFNDADGKKYRLHDGMLEYRVEEKSGVTLLSGYFLPYNSARQEVYVGSLEKNRYDPVYFRDLMKHNMQEIRNPQPAQREKVSMARQHADMLEAQNQVR